MGRSSALTARQPPSGPDGSCWQSAFGCQLLSRVWLGCSAPSLPGCRFGVVPGSMPRPPVFLPLSTVPPFCCAEFLASFCHRILRLLQICHRILRLLQTANQKEENSRRGVNEQGI